MKSLSRLLGFFAVTCFIVTSERVSAGPKLTPEERADKMQRERQAVNQLGYLPDRPLLQEVLRRLMTEGHFLRNSINSSNRTAVQETLRRLVLRSDAEVAALVGPHMQADVTLRGLNQLGQISSDAETAEFLRGLFDNVPFTADAAAQLPGISSLLGDPAMMERVDLPLPGFPEGARLKDIIFEKMIWGATSGFAQIARSRGNDDEAARPLLRALDLLPPHLADLTARAITLLESPVAVADIAARLKKEEANLPAEWDEAAWQERLARRGSGIPEPPSPFGATEGLARFLLAMERPDALAAVREFVAGVEARYHNHPNRSQILAAFELDRLKEEVAQMEAHLVAVGLDPNAPADSSDEKREEPAAPVTPPVEVDSEPAAKSAPAEKKLPGSGDNSVIVVTTLAVIALCGLVFFLRKTRGSDTAP